jgi:hypothetical protein
VQGSRDRAADASGRASQQDSGFRDLHPGDPSPVIPYATHARTPAR